MNDPVKQLERNIQQDMDDERKFDCTGLVSVLCILACLVLLVFAAIVGIILAIILML